MIEVSCGIILKEGKILVAQRNSKGKLPLKWEFPGGKLEKGETAEQSLIREIKEELNIDIEIKSALTPVEHHYKEFSIRLIPFICNYLGGSLINKEHEDVQWVSNRELPEFDWAAADIPIVRELLNLVP